MYFHEVQHELVNYQSKPPMNPLAPNWTLPLMQSQLTNYDEFHTDLRDYAESIPNPDFFRKDSIDLKFDGWTTEETNRIPEYNFLATDNFAVAEFRSLIRKAHDVYCKALNITLTDEMRDALKIQCWVNILPPGESIKPHNHYCGDNSWISGNYSLTANKDTYTAYYAPSHELRIENRPGMLIQFPSHVAHYTNTYRGNDKRITIAYDIFFDKLSQWSGEYPALEEMKLYA